MSGQELIGRRIIVTGAGSGMGRAIARLFAEHGARQTLFDVNADGLAALDIENADTAVVDMADMASSSNSAVTSSSQVSSIRDQCMLVSLNKANCKTLLPLTPAP